MLGMTLMIIATALEDVLGTVLAWVIYALSIIGVPITLTYIDVVGTYFALTLRIAALALLIAAAADIVRSVRER